MLIDDDKEVVDVIEQAIKMVGLQVQSFFNGDEAVKMYPHLRSSIVLIDLSLSGTNGFEVAKQIREISPGDQASLILISGSVSEKIRLQAESLGFAYVLPKPFGIPKLIQIIQELKTA